VTLHRFPEELVRAVTTRLLVQPIVVRDILRDAWKLLYTFEVEKLQDGIRRCLAHAFQHHRPGVLKAFDIVTLHSNLLQVDEVVHNVGGAVGLEMTEDHTQQLKTS